MEPVQVFKDRKAEAPSNYVSHVGHMVDFYSAQLFSCPFAIRPKGDVKADPFFAGFKEDADRNGCDLADFMRARFTQALIKGVSWWVAELPSNQGKEADNRAEWQERALGEAWLSPLDAEAVLDWETDDANQLIWAIVHKSESRRDKPGSSRNTIKETWKVYDRETVETFQIEYECDKPPKEDAEVPSLGSVAHGFARVPLISMKLPEGLHLLGRAAGVQVAHFKMACALDWAIKRACFPMPIMKTDQPEENRKAMVGAGYMVIMGQNDDLTWAAPPTDSFDVISRRIDSLRDELYRVGQQMALGVSNNAAALGRSGESKQADQSSTEICLHAYGAIVREAIQETLNLIASGRGEALDWSVTGLDKFSLQSADLTVRTAVEVMALNLPSEAFRIEYQSQICERLLPDASQSLKDLIREQIAAAPKPEPPKEPLEDLEPVADSEEEPKDLEGPEAAH